MPDKLKSTGFFVSNDLVFTKNKHSNRNLLKRLRLIKLQPQTIRTKINILRLPNNRTPFIADLHLLKNNRIS
jgi:hypothetical protein